MVTGPILPTPAAVLAAAQLLQTDIGDLLVIDVGGATTDVHSVTPGADEIARFLLQPEPLAKRTVEGDLGVFVNARHVAASIGEDALQQQMGPGQDVAELLEGWQALPTTSDQWRLLEVLTQEAAGTALQRHAGRLKQLYGPQGRTTMAMGKDLTKVRYVIGTGGPLTQLGGADGLLLHLLQRPAGQMLLPPATAQVLIDSHYNMAALGVLSQRYPDAALYRMRESLGLPVQTG